MNLILLLCRATLAAVFGVAAGAKLADRAGSQKAIKDFGAPESLARPLVYLLTLAEIAAALLLVVPVSGLWGGLCSLALLATFSAVIAANLRGGRTPDCHCFGQLHSQPIGRGTLVRNGILAAMAALVVWRPQDGHVLGAALDFPRALGAGEALAPLAALAAAALLGQFWLILHLLRQHGRLMLRLDHVEMVLQETGLLELEPPIGGGAGGPPVGSPAPDFELASSAGGAVSLHDLLEGGKPTLLVFSDPQCGPCAELLPLLGRWRRDHAGRFTLAVISRGTAAENREKIEAHGLDIVLLQEDREVAEAYQIPGTPGAALVGPDGRIASPAALGAPAIRRLVDQLVGPGLTRIVAAPSANDHPSPSAISLPVLHGPQIGQPAPSFALPDVNGVSTSIEDGRPTLLLFWNPRCGFCDRMLPDLKLWETSVSADDPALLVISAGEAEANRAMGLESPVLGDPRSAVSRTYAARATPSAILVDERGRIASEPAIGADAVFALARSARKPQVPAQTAAV